MDACHIIRKAKPTIYTWVRKGLLPAYKKGKKLYFYEDELLSWIENRRRKTSEQTYEKMLANMLGGVRLSKQIKGTSFGDCVDYVLKEEKSKLQEAVEVDGTPEQMAEQFELQALLNDKVKNIVEQTSLNLSPEDSAKLKSDDTLMLSIAHDYMKLMGIKNTQYIIAQHIDREHPHCHIVFNRVDNDGKTISDKNDFRRNEKVCKMLTAKYRLHFANGKDHIKKERLRPYDKAKHEIYKALKEELPKAHNWDDLKDALADRDIDMKIKVSRTTREKLIHKDQLGQNNYGLAMKNLNV